MTKLKAEVWFLAFFYLERLVVERYLFFVYKKWDFVASLFLDHVE